MSAWWCVRHGWTAGSCVKRCDRRLIGPFTAIDVSQTVGEHSPERRES